MWKCKTCGCQNPDTVRICRMCRASKPTEAATTKSEATSVKPAWKVLYCGKCGKALIGGESTCRFCEKDVAKFCGKCGKPLVGSETTCRCGLKDTKPTGSRIEKGSYNRLRKVAKIITIAAAAVVLLVGISALTGVFSPSSGNFILEIGSQSVGKAYYEAPTSDHIAEDGGVQYVNNQVIVMATREASQQAIEDIFNKYNLTFTGQIESIGFYQARTETALCFAEMSSLIATLKEESIVEEAYLNTISHSELNAVPNDDWQGDTWDESDSGGANWNMEAIRALTAWQYNDQIGAVNVGVIDSAFINQSDLTFSGIYQNGDPHDVDEDGVKVHGNHVSGVIDATFDNQTGISGLAPNANVFAYSMMLPDAETQSQNSAVKTDGNVKNVGGGDMQILTDLVLLIEKNHARVINISMGGIHFLDPSGIYRTIGTGYANALSRLIEKGYEFLVVVAAGNIGGDATWGSPFTFISAENLSGIDLSSAKIQAVQDRIIIVGAAENKGGNQFSAWWRTNIGERVDIFAPGVGILSCGIDNDYITLDGTSMAAPHVTGTIALIWGANQSLTSAQVKDILLSTATKDVQYSGSPRAHMLDAGAAVEKALGLISEENPIQEPNKDPESGLMDANEALVQLKNLAPSSAGDSLTADCYTIRENETTYTLADVQRIIADGSMTVCELSGCRWTTRVYYVVDWEPSYRWVLFSEDPNGEICEIGSDGFPTDPYYSAETMQMARGDLMYNPQSTEVYYLRQISKFYPEFMYRTEREAQIRIPNDTPIYYIDSNSGESVYLETALEYYNQCADQDTHGAGVGEVCWACGTQPFTVTLKDGIATRIDYNAVSGERFHVFSAPPALSTSIVGTWKTEWSDPDQSNLMYQTEFTFYSNGELLICHLSKHLGNTQIFSEGQMGVYTANGSDIHLTAYDGEWGGFEIDARFDRDANQLVIDEDVLYRAYTNALGELAPLI